MPAVFSTWILRPESRPRTAADDQGKGSDVGRGPDHQMRQDSNDPVKNLDGKNGFVVEELVIVSADVEENFSDQDPCPQFSERQAFVVDIKCKWDKDEQIKQDLQNVRNIPDDACGLKRVQRRVKTEHP